MVSENTERDRHRERESSERENSERERERAQRENSERERERERVYVACSHSWIARLRGPATWPFSPRVIVLFVSVFGTFHFGFGFWGFSKNEICNKNQNSGESFS